jgi:hypothetical protein
MNKKFYGVSLISFLASIAGVIISFLLLKEDVISTAHTVFEYFPSTYGVTPSTSWDGAIILGVFISVLEVVSASVAFSRKFSVSWRVLAAVSLALAGYFDNWTDIVFRSGNLQGDVRIATITTLAFYTFGSEVTQGLSWLVLVTTWRSSISDILWGWYKLKAGWASIGDERKRFEKAANAQEFGSQPKDEKPKQEQNQDKKVTAPLADPNRYNRQPMFNIHKKK